MQRQRALRFILPALAVAALLSAAWALTFAMPSAQVEAGAPGNGGEGHTPVTLCHWVPADGGSYILITVDDDGSSGNANLQGHAGHENDIIPAPEDGCPAAAGETATPGTATATPTNTPVGTATATPTGTLTATATNTPGGTAATQTNTPPPTATNVPADTPTATPQGSGVAGISRSPSISSGNPVSAADPPALVVDVLGVDLPLPAAGRPAVTRLPSAGNSPAPERGSVLLALTILGLAGALALGATVRNQRRT